MKYKLFIIIILLYSCTSISTNSYKKNSLNSEGFAYIYNNADYKNGLISKQINNDKVLIGHNYLKKGSLIKISNPLNGKNIILKNDVKINYPFFYKIMLTEKIANQLNLNKDMPYIEIEEIRKNKSFIAEKAKTFEEEKQLHDSAPVEKVSINNISKKVIKKTTKKTKFIIILGNFYSLKSAKNLKKRLLNETPSFKNKKISIVKKKEHNYEVFLGPYNTINMIKNDYIALQEFNFEEIDVKIYN